uniref:Prostacyclin synthase n=1 Tax=Oryzias melastigma TaxID=30732 RepID=A0A3B3B8T7_ORYME
VVWLFLMTGIGSQRNFKLFLIPNRQHKEPPLDKGLLPWLGHALEFGKDALKFLTRMKEKHGDIFTVRVAGQYVTILLDPNSFDSVLHDTVSLDFRRIRGQVVQKIFGLQVPSNMQTSERKWMEVHFKGVNLIELNSSMNIHLRNLVLNAGKTCGEWQQEGLFSLCYSLLFRAGYLTLFEGSDNAAAVYQEFRNFDDLLTKLARGSLKRDEKKSVDTSQEKLLRFLSSQRGMEPWKRSYQNFLNKEGVAEEMQAKALLLQLWTTQCNAGPAAFWFLGFLLTHPEAMEAVRSEVRGLSLKHPSSTPVFDSALSETLRLTAAVMIRREVVQDKTLVMANGQEYRLRRGDRVCLFPLLGPQMDPQIHPEPQSFKYDRFLNEDRTVKNTFHKNGEQVRYHTLPWGAGRSSCVGKEFAVNAIKQFVFLLLTHLDLELCDPEANLPPVNPSRYGYGMLQPEGDLQVRFRLKRILPEM